MRLTLAGVRDGVEIGTKVNGLFPYDIFGMLQATSFFRGIVFIFCFLVHKKQSQIIY